MKTIMKNLVHDFARKNRGGTLVEFALCIPILLLLVSGIFEVSMFALLNNKLVRIVGTIGNIVAMQNVNAATLNQIIATAPQMATPLTFTGRGAIAVSLIYNNGATTDPNNMLISWQQKTDPTVVSRLGTPGTRPTNIPNNYQVLNDHSIIVTEIFYNYSPYVFTGFIPNQILYKISTFVPRTGTMVTLLTP
jgi:Flp pilus assembly protein TadG